MHEIICPHCRKAFKIDEAGYADILKQVRDSEFEQQLHERLDTAEQDKRNAVELATTKIASELQKATAAKDFEIQELKSRLDAGEVARKLAVTEALIAVEKERDALANELERVRRDKQADSNLAEARLVNELQKAAATKGAEIQGLKAKLDAIEVAHARGAPSTRWAAHRWPAVPAAKLSFIQRSGAAALGRLPPVDKEDSVTAYGLERPAGRAPAEAERKRPHRT